MAFDFTDYMLNVAIKLKDIGHSPDSGNNKFFRISSLGNIEEMITNLTSAGEVCIMVEDNRTGRWGDANSDNYLDNQSYGFFVMKHCNILDADDREAVKNETYNIVKKIFSRMKRDKKNDQMGVLPLTGLSNLDLNSVFYQTIGPVGENYIGTMVHFSMLITLNAELIYNDNDWD